MRNNLKKITFASLVNLFSLHFPRFQPPKHPKRAEKFGSYQKNVYLCTVRVHHASRRTAYQGGTFFICSKMKYNKQPLYAQLCYITYLLNSIEPQNTFTADIKALLSKYPMVAPTEMGFVKNWQNEPLWK